MPDGVLHELSVGADAEQLHHPVLVEFDRPRADLETAATSFMDLPSASSCSTSRSRGLSSLESLPWEPDAWSSIPPAISGDT